MYIIIYVYTVVVTRRRRDDRRVVLFFNLTYVRIYFYKFLLFCFSFISSQTSSLAVAGKLLIPKFFCVFHLYFHKISLSFYNLKKSKVRNRVLTTRSCFTLRGWGGGLYKRLNPAYGLNPRVFMSVTKYSTTQQRTAWTPLLSVSAVGYISSLSLPSRRRRRRRRLPVIKLDTVFYSSRKAGSVTDYTFSA